MSYEELRREFEDAVFRRKMKERLENSCCNCGSEENIEYHHIVPLALGGSNNMTNIVPICHRCHKAAHHGRHISEYADKSNSGRKPKAPIEKSAKVFDMFIGGEIGTRKCKQLLGYSERTQIINRKEFVKYLKFKGIRKVRNNIDVGATVRNNGIHDGDVVGYIEYLDGRVEEMHYKDTGANNVEYKRRT